MIYYIIKVLVSAIIIVAVSELSKKSALVGGIFASIPLLCVSRLTRAEINCSMLQIKIY